MELEAVLKDPDWEFRESSFPKYGGERESYWYDAKLGGLSNWSNLAGILGSRGTKWYYSEIFVYLIFFSWTQMPMKMKNYIYIFKYKEKIAYRTIDSQRRLLSDNK